MAQSTRRVEGEATPGQFVRYSDIANQNCTIWEVATTPEEFSCRPDICEVFIT